MQDKKGGKKKIRTKCPDFQLGYSEACEKNEGLKGTLLRLLRLAIFRASLGFK